MFQGAKGEFRAFEVFLAALSRVAINYNLFLAALLRNPINPKRLTIHSYSKAPQSLRGSS